MQINGHEDGGSRYEKRQTIVSFALGCGAVQRIHGSESGANRASARPNYSPISLHPLVEER